LIHFFAFSPPRGTFFLGRCSFPPFCWGGGGKPRRWHLVGLFLDLSPTTKSLPSFANESREFFYFLHFLFLSPLSPPFPPLYLSFSTLSPFIPPNSFAPPPFPTTPNIFFAANPRTLSVLGPSQSPKGVGLFCLQQSADPPPPPLIRAPPFQILWVSSSLCPVSVEGVQAISPSTLRAVSPRDPQPQPTHSPPRPISSLLPLALSVFGAFSPNLKGFINEVTPFPSLNPIPFLPPYPSRFSLHFSPSNVLESKPPNFHTSIPSLPSPPDEW